jgi:hypothetical protein
MTTLYEPPSSVLTKRIMKMFDETFGTSAKMTDEKVSDFVAEQVSEIPEENQSEVLHAVTRHVYERLTPSPLPELPELPESNSEPEAMQESNESGESGEEADDENDDEDMPGLISSSFCEIEHMLKNGTPDMRICKELWKYSQQNNGESETDDHGRTLMHLALRYRSDSHRIIDTVLEEFEGIETIPDDEGWLPLHYAARYAQTLYPVKELHYWYPEAVLKFTDVGIPPVVFARFGEDCKEIVDFLAAATKRAKADAKAVECQISEPGSVALFDRNRILENAQHHDAFLLALLAIGVFFICTILARTLA